MAKKTKRKWNRTHFFKRKNSTSHKVGHPSLIYAKSGRDYKYLVFTHTPEEGKEQDYSKLKYNINPNEVDKPSYVNNKFRISRDDEFRDPDFKYRIHDDDKELIKRLKR